MHRMAVVLCGLVLGTSRVLFATNPDTDFFTYNFDYKANDELVTVNRGLPQNDAGYNSHLVLHFPSTGGATEIGIMDLQAGSLHPGIQLTGDADTSAGAGTAKAHNPNLWMSANFVSCTYDSGADETDLTFDAESNTTFDNGDTVEYGFSNSSSCTADQETSVTGAGDTTNSEPSSYSLGCWSFMMNGMQVGGSHSCS